MTEFAVPTANSTPLSITAGPDGNLWFTERSANKVAKITRTGAVTEFSVPTPNSGPSGITAGPAGNLWFTEFTGNKVGTLHLSNAFSVAPAVNSITAGTVLNVTVTAQDFHNNTDAAYTGTVHFTSSDPAATLPADYTFTPADNGVHTFSVTLRTAGSRTITVTDTAVSSITGQAKTTSEFSLATAGSQPHGITAGPDGNLWFTEATGNKVGKITPAGAVTEFSVPPGSYLLEITAGPDGNLWFTESGSNKVAKITPTGTVTEFSVPTPYSGLLGITAGPDGNLWFTELEGNKVAKITPTGAVTEFSVPTANSDPGGITAGPDGNLWFTEASNKVAKITPAGAVTEFSVPNATYPRGITAGPDGNLWFTELVNTIGKISPAGLISEYAIPTASGYPTYGITAGPDGNIWFTVWIDNQIGQITPTGNITEFSVPTAVSAPEDITAGPDGNLWFTERNANKIGRLNPAITVTPAAASTLVVAGFPSPTTAGVAHTFSVTAKDPYNNTATGYTGTVHFSSSDAQAGLPADAALTNGTGTFSATLTTAGTQALTATDTGTASITGTQGNITITPAAADHLLFLQQPTDTVAGQTISPAVTLEVLDQFNNVLTNDNSDGVTLTLGNNPGGGTLNGTLTQTVSGGVATFADLSLNQAGSGYTLVANDAGLAGVTSTGFAINPAAADHLVFLQPPSDTAAGQTISPAVVVAVVDQFGNVVTGDNSDTVTLSLSTNPGGGTLSGTLTVTVVNGLATFGDLSIDQPGGGYTLHATIGGGLADIDSDPFSIT